MSLNSSIIIPKAQAYLVAQAELYAKDQVYGTKNCSMTLDMLWQLMELLIAATNPCLTVTQSQLQCFLALLTKSNC